MLVQSNSFLEGFVLNVVGINSEILKLLEKMVDFILMDPGGLVQN